MTREHEHLHIPPIATAERPKIKIAKDRHRSTDSDADQEQVNCRICNGVQTEDCPVKAVINPFWIKVFLGLSAAFGSLVIWVLQESYYSYEHTYAEVKDHSETIQQLKKADIPNRLNKVEITQTLQGQAQDRMETKLDRLFEVWHAENPAPKPTIAQQLNTIKAIEASQPQVTFTPPTDLPVK